MRKGGGGGGDAASGAHPTPTAAARALCGPSIVERPLEAEGEREYVLSGGAKNAVVAVQRYYSNISTDFERQQVRALPSTSQLPMTE